MKERPVSHVFPCGKISWSVNVLPVKNKAYNDIMHDAFQALERLDKFWIQNGINRSKTADILKLVRKGLNDLRITIDHDGDIGACITHLVSLNVLHNIHKTRRNTSAKRVDKLARDRDILAGAIQRLWDLYTFLI